MQFAELYSTQAKELLYMRGFYICTQVYIFNKATAVYEQMEINTILGVEKSTLIFYTYTFFQNYQCICKIEKKIIMDLKDVCIT